jgi:hypothetical protein
MITDEIYIDFIDTGDCPEDVLQKIALKLILNVDMSEQEKTIFFSKTGEVEAIVKDLTANKN